MSVRLTIIAHPETPAQERELLNDLLEFRDRLRSKGFLSVTAEHSGQHCELDDDGNAAFKQPKEVHGKGGSPVGVAEGGTPVPKEKGKGQKGDTEAP